MIAWHAASNWCVQFCFGSVHAPAAVNRNDSGMPASAGSDPAASGQVLHGQRCAAPVTACTDITVMAQRDDEVMEIVLELRHDHARFHGLDPDPPPVGVGRQIGSRSGRRNVTSASG